jgi:hypothetical protein
VCHVRVNLGVVGQNPSCKRWEKSRRHGEDTRHWRDVQIKWIIPNFSSLYYWNIRVRVQPKEAFKNDRKWPIALVRTFCNYIEHQFSFHRCSWQKMRGKMHANISEIVF